MTCLSLHSGIFSDIFVPATIVDISTEMTCFDLIGNGTSPFTIRKSESLNYRCFSDSRSPGLTWIIFCFSIQNTRISSFYFCITTDNRIDFTISCTTR